MVVVLALLEARDVIEPKAILASLVVVVAVLQVTTMSIIYGWLPGSESLRRALTPYHQWQGRFVFTIVVIVAALCLITWGPSSNSTRALVHSILGFTVLFALLAKVVVIRFVPALSRLLPVFGGALLASFVAIWFLTSYWYWFTERTAYSGPVEASQFVKIVDAPGVPGAFQPTEITIKVGEVVQWDQESSRGHTVTGDGFDSGPNGMSRGENFKFQFTKAGTFNYVCIFHGSMKGTVTVTR
jgi:plastocyanin